MTRKKIAVSKGMKLLSAAVCSVCLLGHVHASSISLDEFVSPPDSAKPRVWWHWMNGNVTRDGIEKDLDWMSRMGIGGVQNFDAELMTPLVVDKRIVYMSKDWAELFNFALKTAGEKNFEFAIPASPGWSETGGPWVKPADGMKKLVWSEVVVKGGETIGARLPSPPSTTGKFQDLHVEPEMFGAITNKDPEHYYADIAVVAYKLPDSYVPLVPQRVSANGKAIAATEILDGQLSTAIEVPTSQEQPATLQFDFAEPQVVSSVSLAIPGAEIFRGSDLAPVLKGSEDGLTFKTIASLTVGQSPQNTTSFEPVSVKALKIVFEEYKGEAFSLPSSSAPGAVFGLMAGPAGPKTVKVMDVAFSAEGRIHRFEEKAGFGIAQNYYDLKTTVDFDATALRNVKDITRYLKDDGSIDWTPPKGTWKVVRFGYSLTGKENHPATAEATGLEVDKYDADAVSRYINRYIENYAEAVGHDKIGKQGIAAILNDSIEVGASNWTEDMFAEFKRLRGYDMRPWLPVLTGAVIESVEKSDAFLYDFRRTLADMLAQNHYATITKELHKRGMIHYSEALENGRPSLGDDMAMRSSADIPMAAMWSFDHKKDVGPKPQYWADIRGAASVAHIYGQNLVAAESLTSAVSPWAFSPKDLQPMIDIEFALGVNRPVIHTSVHQPLTDKAPGFSLWIFGQYFNRLDTWAEYAQPWVTYISRNAYMLQQGRFYADVAYFFGEETPLTELYKNKPPTDVPTQNGFDYINSDVILNKLKNDGSDVVAESGARYKVIYLGGTSEYMTLPVLERLAKLVRNGATVVGKKPLASPALMDSPKAFQKLADKLWSGKTGKGRVVSSDNIQQALDELGIAPDFAYTRPQADTTLMFLHRKTDDADIYFYTSRKNRAESLELSFRVTGRKPMHWDAATGKTTPVSYRTEGNHTVIPVQLDAFESGYIVFVEETTETAFTAPTSVTTPLATLDGQWNVKFQDGRGAPTGVQKMSLSDWSASKNTGIKYFSGTAAYEKAFTVETDWLKSGTRLTLDLGTVAELAEVFVNGKSAGISWKPPYVVDVTDFLKAGKNSVEVKVANLWVNRLIGDAQPGAEKVTFTTLDTYNPDAPLRQSGLIGPVKLNAVTDTAM